MWDKVFFTLLAQWNIKHGRPIRYIVFFWERNVAYNLTLITKKKNFIELKFPYSEFIDNA